MRIEKTGHTNFGMAMKYLPDYAKVNNYMFEKLNHKQYYKVKNMYYSQEDNPVDIYVNIMKKNNKSRLCAETGSKKFKENIFQSPVKVLEKAVKYAEELKKEQISNNELLKGFQVPKIG